MRADVRDGEQAVSVTKEIAPLLAGIEAKLPAGYRVDMGGAVEESGTAALLRLRVRRAPS